MWYTMNEKQTEMIITDATKAFCDRLSDFLRTSGYPELQYKQEDSVPIVVVQNVTDRKKFSQMVADFTGCNCYYGYRIASSVCDDPRKEYALIIAYEYGIPQPKDETMDEWCSEYGRFVAKPAK